MTFARILGVRSILVLLAACGAPQLAPAASAPFGHLGDGSVVAVELHGDRITALTRAADAPTWLWPPIVDSHVHLAYWPVADQLAAHGVEAAVDLAAPERTLGELSPIHIVAAGPMLTHPDGYPLDAWGQDGYGLGCRDATCVTAAVDRLAAHGAGVIKLALDDDGLDAALIAVAVATAHAHHLRVAVHALSEASVARAAAAGVDVLAHTPLEPLSAATLAAWRGRAVISTLAAFGGSASAIDNLRNLRAAGAIVLYGTDLGNTRSAGPSADEVTLLRRAGLDDAAITDAMTTAAIAFWGLDLRIAPGAEATFLVLDGDPRRDVRALLAPREVYLRGHRL